MLAAATAIGLASAAHADQLESSTGFEKWTAGEDVVVGTGYSDAGVAGQTSYFWEYAGAVPDDNESRIVSSNMSSFASIRPTGTAFFTGADNGNSSKILQVSTGTDPLLRRFRDNGANFTLGGSGSAQVYIDTLVQFTVTPMTDSVANTEQDKLMIYLKESPKIEAGVPSETETVTNLVVKGGFYKQDFSLEAKDYTVHNMTINPGEWYRLTVKAIPNFGNLSGESFPAFFVSINGTACTFDECVMEESAGDYPEPFVDGTVDSDTFDAIDNKTFVLSMVKGDEQTGEFGLRAVGFAGEGGVDDLVISTFDPTKTVVDFTFNLAGVVEGYATELSYTCSVSKVTGGVAAADGTKTFKCFADDIISVAYTLNANYTGDWTFTGGASISGNEVTPVANGSATLTVSASGGSDWVDDPTTVSNQTAATAYPALAGSALANADAQQLTVWAKANSVAFNDATTTPGDYVEAFLLNCAPVAATVAAEKEAFVLDISVAADGTVTVSLPAGKSYNGTLQLKGSTDLSTWTDISAPSSSYNFYKYELSL